MSKRQRALFWILIALAVAVAFLIVSDRHERACPGPDKNGAYLYCE